MGIFVHILSGRFKRMQAVLSNGFIEVNRKEMEAINGGNAGTCILGTAGSAGLGFLAGAGAGTVTIPGIGTVSGAALGAWSGAAVGYATFCGN